MQPGQHRETARVVLINESGEIFLLLTEFDPEVGLPARWLTPGGGIDHQEPILDAAIRELREETGLEISPEALSVKIGSFSGRWHWGDGENFHTYVDHVFYLEVNHFELDDTGWTDEERRDILHHRWWPLDELELSGEPVSPPGLVEALRNHRSA
jgi:8-oxo-dGTP pyrophosphatase MutT (NUDIX family)